MTHDTLQPPRRQGRPRSWGPLGRPVVLAALAALSTLSVSALGGCSGPAAAPAKASLSVTDQDLVEPRVVRVAAAHALEPGWVAVWTDAGGGAPGESLGAVFVDAGEHADLDVPLSRDAADLEPLVAVLHVDAGALGVFEPGGDPVAAAADGTLVTASFVVHVGERVIPALAVDDQRADPPDAVAVGPVVSDGPGFIVIRTDKDGEPGEIIGHLAVPNRLSGPHAVPLDRPAQDGETLWAMLHRDSGVPGVFEVPSGDPVFLDEEGAPVGASFRVEVPIKPALEAFNGLAPYPPDHLSLKRVAVDEPGWLVVRADDGGQPGEILGSAPVPHGDHRPFSLTLSRTLTNAEPLYATLHRDAGAVGTLELPTPDEPLLGPDGQPLSVSFFVSVPTPGLTVGDQIADPADLVVVDQVSSLGPGWVLIRADAQGAPGEVLGSVAVEHYKSTGVEVTLNRPIVDGEALWATLHQDAEPRGELHASDGDGDGEDVPQLGGDGAPVRVSFVVSTPPDAAVAVVDQVLAPADQVVVDSATTYGPGWVAIQEDDAGAPGAILGATALGGGLVEGVTVDLDRPAVDAETLWAVVYLDRGDPASLDPGDPDEPAVDADGASVAASFVASVPAVAVGAVDQIADPRDQVILAQVVAQGDVVVAVAADAPDAPGTPGEILGSVALGPGVHDDVAVTLSREVTFDEPLHAVLYADADPVGTFEPGGADQVLTDAGGAPVATTFSARWAPEVIAQDQTLGQGGAPATQVTVAEVVSEGAGWVAVAEEDPASPNGAGTTGLILGHVAAPAGLSSGLSVTLSRPAVDGEVLYVVLYADAGIGGTFEPQGADAPVSWPPDDPDGGAPVVAAFTVTVLPPPPSVSPGAAAVAGLSTVVTLNSAYAPDGGWVVVAEDPGGGIEGAALGHALLGAGTTADVAVELDRPLADGEALVAVVYGDAGAVGTFEPGGADAAISGPAAFSASVPVGTPAVRVTLDDASGAFVATAVEPGTQAQAVGGEPSNPTLALLSGWRYEVVVATAPLGTHPLELVTQGATSAEDVVLLGAGTDPGTLAADAGIAADTSTLGAMRFTVSPTLAAAVDGYRCGVDVDGARGAVTVASP